MKIDAPISLPENIPTSKVSRSGSSAAGSRSAATDSGQDRAQLSADSATVEHLKARLAHVPDIRQDRVDALRQAVNGGNYHVADQQLGEAISSDLLGKVIG